MSSPSHEPSPSPGSTTEANLAAQLRALDIEALRRRRVAKWHNGAPKYNAWIADMDFPVAAPIAAALRGVIDADELGYPTWTGERSPATFAFADRMATKYDWAPSRDDLFDMADVLQGVQVALEALTAVGDAVVLHLPAYYPFLDTISQMNRELLGVTADPAASSIDGEVAFDYDALEAELERRARSGDLASATAWILCHPHNPLGHVFQRDELERIAAIADRFDLVVISDEIHADLRYGTTQHVPFAVVADPARVVTVSSASKAFNLAGLRWAVLHAGPERLNDWLAKFPSHLLGAANRMGVDAAVAAWTDGDRWLSAVLDVLDENRLRLVDLFAQHLPGARYRPPAATYLAWVDVSECGLGDDPAGVFRSHGIEVSAGPSFGAPGAGHIRINFATSPRILAETVAAMGEAARSVTGR